MIEEFYPSKEDAGARVLTAIMNAAQPDKAFTVEEMVQDMLEQKVADPGTYAEMSRALLAANAEIEKIIFERMEALRG